MSDKTDGASKVTIPLTKLAYYEGFGSPKDNTYLLEPRLLLDAAAAAVVAEGALTQDLPTDADSSEALTVNVPQNDANASDENSDDTDTPTAQSDVTQLPTMSIFIQKDQTVSLNLNKLGQQSVEHIEVMLTPQHGNVVVLENGELSYQASDDYRGNDQFIATLFSESDSLDIKFDIKIGHTITTANQQILDDINQQNLSVQQVVFVDNAVSDPSSLLGELDDNTVVFTLNSQLDGIQQIDDILSKLKANQPNQNISGLHLVSHGDAAELYLGNSQVTLQNMQNAYKAQLQHIGSLLSADADLLIYGCNFGAGSAGAEAVAELSALTGADIAASDDLTASTALQGDAELEVTIGEVATAQVINEHSIANYQAALALPLTDAGSLINGLGDVDLDGDGTNDFGTEVNFTWQSNLRIDDDGQSTPIDLTSITDGDPGDIWANGVKFNNTFYSDFIINNNSMIAFVNPALVAADTFDKEINGYSPSDIVGGLCGRWYVLPCSSPILD